MKYLQDSEGHHLIFLAYVLCAPTDFISDSWKLYLLNAKIFMNLIADMNILVTKILRYLL